MNHKLTQLQSYPFAKLAKWFEGVRPNPDFDHITLGIGEPQMPPAPQVLEALAQNTSQVQFYPNTRGSEALRAAIATWLQRRFGLKNIDSHAHILPTNGSREALFAIAQVVIEPSEAPLVLLPNPFYQIYEGAALLAGAEPFYYCLDERGGFDFDQISPSVWQRCQLLYLCSPNNPTGSVMDLATLQKLITLAQQYDFVIVADECYCEIYQSSPPPSILQACEALGLDDYPNCIAMHSLSKRSSLPGLRSGFAAGDKKIMQAFFDYRTYHGSAMSPMCQAASVVAWQDEAYPQQARDLYQQKISQMLADFAPVWPQRAPAASFYLYARVGAAFEHSGAVFAKILYQEQNITVLPCAFLARNPQHNVIGSNLADQYVRIALVPSPQDCAQASARILNTLKAHL